VRKAKSKARPRRAGRAAGAERAVYRGKQARSGNSLALRFERALFRSHPEFSGDVEARVIAPGRMVVTARRETSKSSGKDDPALRSFLRLLAADLQNAPERITPLDRAAMERARALTAGVETSLDEDLGDKALL